MAQKYFTKIGEDDVQFEIEQKDGKLFYKSEGKTLELDCVKIGESHYSVMHEGQSYDLRLYHTKTDSHIFLRGDERIVSVDDYQSHMRKKASGGAGADVIHGKAELTAQMPGKVVGVKVKEGDEVTLGQGLVVLEAMKMENEIVSPKAGKVTKVAAVVGQSVESGALLVVVE